MRHTERNTSACRHVAHARKWVSCAHMARLIDASDIITQLLHEHGLTQAEFAGLAGVTVATVNRWAKGHQMADARKVAAAMTQLGENPAAFGIALRRPSTADARAGDAASVQSIIDALQEDQRRRHEELLAVLTEIRTGIDILRQRT